MMPATRRALLALPALAGCARFPDLPEGGIEASPLFREAMGAPPSEGNAVRLLPGGRLALSAKLDAIAGARDHLHLEFFTLEDVRLPGEARSLFALLAGKAREGVPVAVTYDSVGTGSTTRAQLGALREAGVTLLSYNPANPLATRGWWLPNHRTHRKILVVDGRVAFTGGVNLDDVYENRCGPGAADPEADADAACWDDLALRVEGPAVGDFQRLFLDTWARQGGPPLPRRDWFPPPGRPGRVTMRVVGSSPGAGRPLFHVLRLAALAGARRRATVCTGYFVPAPREMRELLDAARRGVAVRVLVPRAGDHMLATSAQRALYGELFAAGVRVFETTDRIIHAKVTAVDGTWCAVGSSNFDRRSAAWNDEVDVVFPEAGMTRRVDAFLDGRIAAAREARPEEWARRGTGRRLREALSWPFRDQL